MLMGDVYHMKIAYKGLSNIPTGLMSIYFLK